MEKSWKRKGRQRMKRGGRMEQRETSERKRLLAVFWLDVAIVACEIIGTVITAHNHGLGVFRFFTENSNFFALFACACEAICITRFLRDGVPIPRWSHILKYLATCCLMMTFLVVYFILVPWAFSAGYDGVKMLLVSGAQPFMHTLCPLVAFISFAFLQTDISLGRKFIWLGAAPVYLYGAISTLLNVLRMMVGPYPFLYVYQQPVWASILWIVALCGLGTVIAAGVWAVNRHRTKQEGFTQ